MTVLSEQEINVITIIEAVKKVSNKVSKENYYGLRSVE